MYRQPDDPGVHGPRPEKPQLPLFTGRHMLLIAAVTVAFMIVLSLSGCKSQTFTGYTPPVLINGYDPTLRSHREGLGLEP